MDGKPQHIYGKFEGKGIELHLDNSNYLIRFDSIHLFYFGMKCTAKRRGYGANSGNQETRVVRLDTNGVYCTRNIILYAFKYNPGRSLYSIH